MMRIIEDREQNLQYMQEKIFCVPGQQPHLPMILDTYWENICTQLKAQIDKYKGSRLLYWRKSGLRKAQVQQLEDWFERLHTALPEKRAAILYDALVSFAELYQTVTVEKTREKESHLQTTLSTITRLICLQLRLEGTAIGRHPLDPMAEVQAEEERRLGTIHRQYVVLHDLKATWWQAGALAFIKQLPASYYSQASIGYFNTIGPRICDESILKALQVDQPVLDAALDIDFLRERGSFLLRLGDEPHRRVFRALVRKWWSVSDTVLSFHLENHTPEAVAWLNDLEPNAVDEDMLVILQVEPVNFSVSADMASWLQRRAAFRRDLDARIDATTLDVVRRDALLPLVAAWWPRIEEVLSWSTVPLSKPVVDFLNRFTPEEILSDPHVLAGFTNQLTTHPEDVPPEMTTLRNLGRQRLLLGDRVFNRSPALRGLNEAWWQPHFMEWIRSLSPSCCTEAVVSFLNGYLPQHLSLDQVLINGLSRWDQRTQLSAIQIRILAENRPVKPPTKRARGDMSASPRQDQMIQKEINFVGPEHRQAVYQGLQVRIATAQAGYDQHAKNRHRFFKKKTMRKNAMMQTGLATAVAALSSVDEGGIQQASVIISTIKVTLKAQQGCWGALCAWLGIRYLIPESTKVLDSLIQALNVVQVSPQTVSLT